MIINPTVILVPGAGGGSPSAEPFRAGFPDGTRFEVVSYPSWRRYLENDPCFEDLVDGLSRQIQQRTPEGPIQIIGFSLGGHLGYVTATRLQEERRQIASFCAVDSFIVHSAAAGAGWFNRVIALCMGLIARRKFGDLAQVVRSRFWRAVLRALSTHLIGVIRMAQPWGLIDSLCKADPLLEHELDMRLLVQMTAPSLAAIDKKPPELRTSAIFLRTARANDSDERWRRRCPGIKIYSIPGDHHTMLDGENISVVSRIFSAAIRESCQRRNRDWIETARL